MKRKSMYEEYQEECTTRVKNFLFDVIEELGITMTTLGMLTEVNSKKLSEFKKGGYTIVTLRR